MPARAPRRGLLAALAAGCALIFAARDAAQLLRERGGDARAAALLWPDPLGDADAVVRELARGARGDPARAFVAAEAAAALAPRRGAIHLRAGMLAIEARQDAAARRELARARESDPFHGELQAAVARELLVGAVERRCAGDLELAARSFTAAVVVGALPCEEAYVALSAAGAPRELLARVAGREPRRMTALVEHLARLLDRDGALAFADELDRLRRDDARSGRALAHRRLGAAAFAAGAPEQAARDFAAARALAADPDALALDLADALLQSGAPVEGVAALARALQSGHADAARAAGSIRSAQAPPLATSALFELARASDAGLRTQLAAVLAELGEKARSQELLAQLPTTAAGRAGAPRHD